MKKVLITGKKSYIGEHVAEYLIEKGFKVETIDMKTSEWRKHDFSQYDVVFHVAGIAHADVGRVTEEKKKFYYEINTNLAIETAKKARSEQVSQFIFMSSMIIYGDSAPVGGKKVITRETKPEPSNFYGDSKLRADFGIQELETEQFRVVILRPPMIYGEGCKGNYMRLSKLAQKTSVFPRIKNERSMLHIENLCRFVELMIENEERGIFFPQNHQYSQTTELVSRIAAVHGRHIWVTPLFNWVFFLLGHVPGKIGGFVNKVFGNSVYELAISDYSGGEYRMNSLEESIRKTEMG